MRRAGLLPRLRHRESLLAILPMTLFTVLTGCSSGSEYMAGDAHAIELARHAPGVSRIETHSNFDWYVVMYCTARLGKCPSVPWSANPKLYPIRVVCYCDRHSTWPFGWFIEVNLLTNSARVISGDRKLQKVYGLP